MGFDLATLLYVDPHSQAQNATIDYPATAEKISVIANQPQAKWFCTWDDLNYLTTYLDSAKQLGQVPQVVLYYIPNRDNGSYSAGGARDLADYQQWISTVHSMLAKYPAVVIIEPDALASLSQIPANTRADRLQCLSLAVKMLAELPNVYSYIDVGHCRWLSVDQAVTVLKAVNVNLIRGFSLNVSNFYTCSENIPYGEVIRTALGTDTYFVIDSSRNGQGPASDQQWCNPPGRGLGVIPTSKTAGAHCDAYLWIKRPGESDGTLNGGPTSGLWFNDYAVNLVDRRRK